ncbi:hypothetical protein ACLQ25_09385 [Micromonospora sp. DT44]|uniref:hypothetical protein n=1 Tax=Micromonospora sp. DT44 TaxID=3393439 RepID=UPI003CEFE7FC
MRNPFRRRRQPVQLDQTSPAAPGTQRATGEATPPARRGPTLITTVAPLMTPGQVTRTCGDMR